MNYVLIFYLRVRIMSIFKAIVKNLLKKKFIPFYEKYKKYIIFFL